MAEAVTAPDPPGTNARPQLPAEVEVRPADLTSVAFTPRQLDAIRETYGRSWGEIMSDETSDDKFVLTAWLKLQDRLGPFPAEAMRDLKIRISMEAPAPDPTAAANSTTSSGSAGSGG